MRQLGRLRGRSSEKWKDQCMGKHKSEGIAQDILRKSTAFFELRQPVE